MHDQDDTTDPQNLPPSKSRLKRDAHALAKLGAELAEISRADWLKLALPEALVGALEESRRIHSHGAHKRQMQYIGKLMRDIDPAPIQQYFEQQRLESRRQIKKHHRLEEWRDRLIKEADKAIQEFLTQYPQADRQHLRQLVRQARKESEQSKPARSSRTLFKYLRELDATEQVATD